MEQNFKKTKTLKWSFFSSSNSVESFLNHARMVTSLALDVILQIKVLVQSPVDEFGEKNLTPVVGVNLVEFSLPIFDGSDPLLDGRLDAVGGELLLGDLVVVAGVDPIKSLVELEVFSQGLEEKPELPELEEVGPVLVLAGGGLLGEVEGPLDGGLAIEKLVTLKDIPHAAVDLSKGKVSILIGIELLEELLPLLLVLVGPGEGQLRVDLLPVNGHLG